MMRRLMVIGMALLAGCAGTGQQGQTAAYVPPPAAETDQGTRARIHTELASGYFEVGNYGVALQEANEALKSDSSYAPAYNVLALVYMELRDDAAAEQNFQRALRLVPQDSDTNNNYGWFLCRRQREKESLKYFLTALRNPLYKTPEKAWVNAGVCSRQAGDVAAAEDYFQRAVKMKPNQPQALFNLADLSYRDGRFGQAKTYLGQLQREVAPNAEVLWLALRIERQLGNRNAEASYGFQLRKNFPDSRETRALLANQYE
jgi:type IV pilus assembly protein PilF